MANATSEALTGSVEGFSKAIEIAQNLKSGRPLYKQAQDLVDRWQQEIADVKVLDMAKQAGGAGRGK